VREWRSGKRGVCGHCLARHTCGPSDRVGIEGAAP
jgi:hypothetical protein